MPSQPHPLPDRAIEDFLVASGLISGRSDARFRPLTGGVSSDIWLIESSGRRFCVKRALSKLRVKAEWFAPVERSAYESAWLKSVARVLPAAVPEILAEDTGQGIFAMSYLDPSDHRCWKAELLAGRADRAVAAEVGARLGTIHSAFARDQAAPDTFDTDGIFLPIRLEPYLLATAQVHPDLAHELTRLAERTLHTKRTVVHGDVSPKNILVGPNGPVFLDAECAWWGDPAFDLAFCLNHLLLKCVAAPQATADLLACYSALAETYLARVDWEAAEAVESRAASLLPALFLARIDGKSPVEYIVDDDQKDRVRRAARTLLMRSPARLEEIRAEWADRL